LDAYADGRAPAAFDSVVYDGRTSWHCQRNPVDWHLSESNDVRFKHIVFAKLAAGIQSVERLQLEEFAVYNCVEKSWLAAFKVRNNNDSTGRQTYYRQVCSRHCGICGRLRPRRSKSLRIGAGSEISGERVKADFVGIRVTSYVKSSTTRPGVTNVVAGDFCIVDRHQTDACVS
jgi:hypothetical protein